MTKVYNIDSKYDWSNEVRKLWDGLDWDRLAQTAPGVSEDEWDKRRDELTLIGLCSSLTINRAYCGWNLDEENYNRDNEEENENDCLLEGWRKRQRNQRNINSDISAHRFNGEEPHFRSPKLGGKGIVECYGIYVDNWANFLGDEVRRATDGKGIAELGGGNVKGWSAELREKKNPPLPEGPAIFLCPERIVEIYPTLMTLDEKFQRPLPLSSNPTLVNLKMLLLHEMGHHFFPVHKWGIGKYVSEAFANRFCLAGIEEWEERWLLYKTWRLQPPEYSAYRPLNLLFETDNDYLSTIEGSFKGNLTGWATLPDKSAYRLEDNLNNASPIMALAADTTACYGIWQELRQFVSDKNRDLLPWDGGGIISDRFIYGDGRIPADLVFDLYRQNDMVPWALTPGLSNDLWCGWGMGRGKSWPEDCFHITDHNADKWIELYDRTPYTRVADSVQNKLDALSDDPKVIDYIKKVLDHPDNSPQRRPLEETILVLDWMLAIAEGHVDRSKTVDRGSYMSAENPRALIRIHTYSTTSQMNIKKDWIEALADFANKKINGLDDYGKVYWRRQYALSLLKRIQGFQFRPTLAPALADAADSAAYGDDWHKRVKAIEFLGACKDHESIWALKLAIKPASYKKIKSIDMDVRSTAASVLRKIGYSQEIKPLFDKLVNEFSKTLLNDEDSYYRYSAAEALGKIGDTKAVEPLITALEDKNEGVRGASAEALGKIGDPRAVEPLIAMSQDMDDKWALKKTATRALEEIRNKNS